MSLRMERNEYTGEVLVKLTEPELANKTLTYAMEIIATRLADRFIEKHGDTVVHDISVEELKTKLKERIEARLAEIDNGNS